MEFAPKMFGVRRGPLTMRPTWEVLPVRMLRLLVRIEEAEKASRLHSATANLDDAAATETDLTLSDNG